MLKPGVLATLAHLVQAHTVRPEARAGMPTDLPARRLGPVTIKTLATQNSEFWTTSFMIRFKSVRTQIGGYLKSIRDKPWS